MFRIVSTLANVVVSTLEATSALFAVCLSRRNEMESLIERRSKQENHKEEVLRDLGRTDLSDDFSLLGHQFSVVRIGDCRLDVTVDRKRLFHVHYGKTAALVRRNGKAFILADNEEYPSI